MENATGIAADAANGIAFQLAARDSRLGTFVLVTDHDALAVKNARMFDDVVNS